MFNVLSHCWNETEIGNWLNRISVMSLKLFFIHTFRSWKLI